MKQTVDKRHTIYYYMIINEYKNMKVKLLASK